MQLLLWCLAAQFCVNVALSYETPKKVQGTLYRWKQIDFDYPTTDDRQAAINNGQFIQRNVIPLGIERWKNRVFVSTPRWEMGVPASLSSLPTVGAVESPPLAPYPSWDWHNADNCTGFTSVFRMNIDHCGVMWVIDSGQVKDFETSRQICPPTLFAIDLETNTVIRRFPIPERFVLQNSLITNLVVDSRDARCRDLHVYIADTYRFGLIVFRHSDAAFWRFSHYTFYPEPLLSNYTLHGLNYQWSDGLLGMSLGKLHLGDRLLYYHSMSSSLEFFVNTSVLRDPKRVDNAVSEFKLLGESRGPAGQVSAAAIDRNGVMFFGLISQDSIGCWNTRKEYKKDNLGIVAQSNKILVFPNDLRIDHEAQQVIWIIINKLPMYELNLLNPEEYNYRVIYIDPVAAVEGTTCEPYPKVHHDCCFLICMFISTFQMQLLLWCLAAQLCVNVALSYETPKKVQGTLYRWKQIDFDYPTTDDREAAINNGQFIQRNVIPLGIERWKNRVFVSTPRWKKGVPASLSSLPTVGTVESPPLAPYPSWDWHNADNCTGFTSVFRMNIDHCGVMWVLDSGQVEAFETPRQICPPTLFAIDLETNTVIRRFPIPERFVLQNSLITNLVVDSRDARCRDLHVYIADAWRFGLIVFRHSDAAFWRFSHYTFYPEPLLSNYTLHGLNYQWSDGLFGMSLGKLHLGDRPLYYHSMSSSLEFFVNTSVIRDPKRVDNAVSEFKLLGESRGPAGQVSAAAIDRNGVMFFSLISQDSIGCWNTRKEYKKDNLGIVAQSNKILVFPNDLRIDHEAQQVIWIIVNKLPMYQFNLLNPEEYNYRVIYIDPVAAVEGTACEHDHPNIHHDYF
ncbi:uncharacterized protein [Epargyreus clarus]|uniref:uncharacterized protein n=1 Tax=Epargyreus clarus TaxID=520877 RepID=UPI003C304A55